MFTITVEVQFCYGHRLMNHRGKCRHLHGHSARAAITLAAPELDEQGMVTDFSEAKSAVAGFVSDLDHNLLLHKSDPLCPLLLEADERFLPLDQHPTAENLAKMIYDHLKRHNHPVCKVVLWETSSASASYEE